MDKRASFFKRASDAEPQQRNEKSENINGYEQRTQRRNFDDERGERGGFERRERGSFDRKERGGFERRDRGDFERRDRGGFERRERRFSDDDNFTPREQRGERGGFVVRPRSTDSEYEERPERRERSDRYERRDRPNRGDNRGDRRNDNRGEKREFLDKDGNAKRMIGGKPITEPKNLIFGVHPVNEALEAGRSIEKIYTVKRGNESLQAIEELANEAGIPIQYVPTEKLDYLSKRNNHQGVVATIAEVDYADFSAVMDKNPTLLLILDGVTDVRNFGAIARTAECAGVDAIIVSAKNSAPVNGEAMKSSAGALTRIPVCKVGSLRNTARTMESAGIQLVAATEKAESSLYSAELTAPTAIVMGSEERGISGELLKLCPVKASIPLVGNIESLNVGVAAAIMLFEAVRQRSSVQTAE